MQLSLEEVTRGHGKVFVHVAAEGHSTGMRLRATSHAAGGAPLPASVIDAPEGVGGWVLVVPVSDVAQDVVVEAIGQDGRVFARVSQHLDAAWARHRSQLNTALRNPVALAIRNCDEGREPEPGQLSIRLLRVVPDHDKEILHVELTAAGNDRAALGQHVELRALDANGASLASAEPISLGDVTLEDELYPGTYHRRVTLSVRIPRGTPTLVLWAHSGSDAMLDGWHLWEQGPLDDERREWYNFSLSADRDPNYDWWFRARRAKPWELVAQREANLPARPTFSVVVPLYQTPPAYLREMAASVLAQTYDALELVLVNGSPNDAPLAAAVADLCRADGRVRQVTLTENLGIVGNTNAGVAVATGDFVCFMDHDDVLEPDCLWWYAKAACDYPTTDLIYCDEDKLVDGHFEQVFFKPDWSPDTLRSQNYVCHLLCVRHSLLHEVGPLDPAFEGAQDLDLTLRVGERARNVFHVRRVLYHWRVHPGSTAADAGEKSYTTQAGVRAVQAHLDRMGIDGEAYEDERIANVFHVRYRFAETPLVSILIPNKDAVDLLEPCLASIRKKTNYSNYEVVVVENNSTDPGTFAFYERARAEDARVRVVSFDAGGAFNYSKLMNYGVTQTRGAYVLMLNNDTEVISPGWIEALLGHVQEQGVGCAGAKLLYPDGTIQHAGVTVHRGGPYHTGLFLPRDCDDYYHSFQITRNYSAVTGACLMVRRAVYDELGGLDESYAADYNDVDFCLRLVRAGYRCVYEPTCELYHLESVSRGKNETRGRAVRFSREQGRLQQAWPEHYVWSDPYVSPGILRVTAYWHLDL